MLCIWLNKTKKIFSMWPFLCHLTEALKISLGKFFILKFISLMLFLAPSNPAVIVVPFGLLGIHTCSLWQGPRGTRRGCQWRGSDLSTAGNRAWSEPGQLNSVAGHWILREVTQRQSKQAGSSFRPTLESWQVFQECLFHRFQGLTWLLSLQRLILQVP